MPFEIGRRIGDYEILGLLGTGGMGQVYRVRNTISNRMEAMKVLLPDSAAEPQLADRFLSEIRTLAAFDHPNIAQLRTAFQADNQLLMVMELVEGQNLEERNQAGNLPLHESLGYMEQVLDALSYAHSRGVIHRDVKPANIMITPAGTAKLLDFGIAKVTEGSELTQTGATLGSVLYMSPEQVKGQPVDARSDLYSVGVVLYRLATGRPPFETDNLYRLMEMQMNEAPAAPVEVNSSVPPALSQIIVMSLAKDPQSRFQKADALRNALASVHKTLEPASANMTAAARTTTQPQAQVPAPKVSGHRGLWITVGALAVLAIAVAGAFLMPYWNRAQAHPPAAEKTISTPATSPATETPPEAAKEEQQNTAPAPVVKKEVTIYDVKPAKSAVKKIPVDLPPQPPASSELPSARIASPAAPVANSAKAQLDPESLEKAKERIIQLGTRAAAVKDSIDRLRAEQASSGLGLRQDIAASLGRMSVYMDEAEHALNTGDLKLSEKWADQADKEITSLEEFTGR
jgi:serine/threonine-protein kinase